MTASAFSLSAAYPEAAFALLAGEPSIGGMHGATRHYFCPHCMSWIYTQPAGMQGFVNVRLTMLDQPDGSPPFIEFYRNEGLPWAGTGATHSFETAPEDAAFLALLAEYADTIAKEAS